MGWWPRSRRPKTAPRVPPVSCSWGPGRTPDLNWQEEAHGPAGSVLINAPVATNHERRHLPATNSLTAHFFTPFTPFTIHAAVKSIPTAIIHILLIPHTLFFRASCRLIHRFR
jgi:hypothetical protein